MNIRKLIALVAICICCLFVSCWVVKIDYEVKADWVYVNGTEHVIHVISAQGSHNFTIGPNESYTINVITIGPETTTEESYGVPFDEETIIVIDGETEITVSGGIADRKNYTVKKITARHFEFTYTFTDADLVTEE